MKHFGILLAFALFLTSCVSSPAPTPTLVPIGIQTATPSPTPEPSPTAASTLTPTPTVDPNMPPGATGKDKQGNWTKIGTENGKIVTYEWFPDLHAWFSSHILDGTLNGGIPLIEVGDWTPIIPFYFYAEEGVLAPYLRHTAGPTDAFAPNFSNAVITPLLHSHFGKSLLKIPAADRVTFNLNLEKGNILYPFKTGSGNYQWTPGPTIGYQFYVIKWDDADPALHPNFYETHEGIYKYRWTIYARSDGTLVVTSAVKSGEVSDAQNVIDDHTFYSWILSPMAESLVLSELSQKVKYFEVATYFLPNAAIESGCKNVTVLGSAGIPNKTVKACVMPYFDRIPASANP